ncbi:hexokinase-2-like [Engraulis encrasicolus]|uniref:hexokinase-2-like n=1 Tax=Engraulis encrasicolus TaxID=184585 RepID=UPI002FCFFE1A
MSIIESTTVRAYCVFQVDEVLEPFHLAPEKLKEMSRLLEESFQKGLSKDTHDVAEVKMLPTHIRNIPTGTETGDFLALDLGGTNVRVLHVRLEDNVQSVLYKKRGPIPEDIWTGEPKEEPMLT